MLKFQGAEAGILSTEGRTSREKPFPAIFSTMLQLVISGRPECLIHNDRVSFIDPQFLQFPPSLKVIPLFRQILLIFMVADYSFGESVLLDDQFQPFTAAIQKDLVV